MSELRNRLLADNRLGARPRYHNPTTGPVARNDRSNPAGSTIMLTAKSIKATVVLDAAALLDVTVANGSGPVPFVITVGDQSVKGQFNAKTLRRAVTAVREAGAENVAVVVNGGSSAIASRRPALSRSRAASRRPPRRNGRARIDRTAMQHWTAVHGQRH